jgi:hypothetical protein
MPGVEGLLIGSGEVEGGYLVFYRSGMLDPTWTWFRCAGEWLTNSQNPIAQAR